MTDLSKIEATLKTGQERLTFENKVLGFSLLDFWRWSVSDILSNATRGRFAEFIVGSALGIDIKNTVRDEWGAYDLKTQEGIKIEVKSAAYIQSWFQKALSKISFGAKPALGWDNDNNRYTDVKTRSADVYVFCLLHHTVKATCDPLNLDHWEFYVLSTEQLNNYTRSQNSITLNSLQKLTGAIKYNELNDSVNFKANIATK